jgi:hypothetical protein
MKNVLLLGALALFTLTSCKKETTRKMTVIKDCTGSYLRIDGKDYNVCNYAMLEPFPNNATVTASYKRISGCTNDRIVCMMFHENEGWIEVVAIR